VTLGLIPLGQFRPAHLRIPFEKYSIEWKRKDQIQTEWSDSTDILVPPGKQTDWEVVVKLSTPFVVKDYDRVLEARQFISRFQCE
jgi:hypothetical protein